MPTKGKKVSKKVAKKVSLVKEYEKRIASGVRFLDRKVGRKKWLKAIDLSVFTIDSNHYCVLAQVYKKKQNEDNGIYRYVENTIGLQKAADMGFHCDTSLWDIEVNKKLLSAMWYVKLSTLKKV